MKARLFLALLALLLVLLPAWPLRPAGAAGVGPAALPQHDSATLADAPLAEQARLRLFGVAAAEPAGPIPEGTLTRLRLSDGENKVISSVLDAANGYAYFGLNCSPGKILKVRLSDFTRVDEIVLADDENHVGTAVLDAANGYAYFGVNSALGSKITKVRLSDFTRVADLPMQPGERFVLEGVIDPAGGYAYFTIQHLTEKHRLIKVRLSDFSRVDQLEYLPDEIAFSAAIDTTNGYIYLGMNWNAVTRIRLSDFTRLETRVFWGYGGWLYSAAVDPAGGYVYFGTETDVLRFRLSDFTFVDSIFTDWNGIFTLTLDTPHGYLYASHEDKFGGPDKVFKIRLADFVSEGSLTLASGERPAWTSILDAGTGMLYLGIMSEPGIIVKVDLSTFTRVGAITLKPGSPYPDVGVIDTVNGYAYFGNTNTYPGRIYKVRLSDFRHVDSIILADNAESDFQSAVIDVAGGYAYFATDTEPGRIVRIRLSDFTHAGTLTLAAGENDLQAAAIDPDNGFAYFGTNTNPGRIVKVDLATFTRVDALTLPAGEGRVYCGVADPDNGFAYFGISGKIVKIDLATFTRADALSFDAGGWYPEGPALLDPLTGQAYFNLLRWGGYYPKILQVDLATFTQVTIAEFPTEKILLAGAIDPAGGYLYMATVDNITHILTIRLSDLTLVETTTGQQGDMGPQSAVIDPDGGYVYFGAHTQPAGIIIRMSLDVAIAGLSAVNDSPTTLGQPTTLTATVTAGTNVVFTWDLGDGSPTATGPVVTHTYPSVGTFTAVVTATNGNNQAITSTLVTIQDVAIVGLSAVNDSPTALGQPTTLTATVTAGTNVIFTWDFGDGTPTTTGAIVTHTYAAVGTYTATVTATNSIGVVTQTTAVTIEPIRFYIYLPAVLRQYP